MIAERFPEIAQLPDEDKLPLMTELWQDVTDGAAYECPELAAGLELRWQEHLRSLSISDHVIQLS